MDVERKPQGRVNRITTNIAPLRTEGGTGPIGVELSIVSVSQILLASPSYYLVADFLAKTRYLSFEIHRACTLYSHCMLISYYILLVDFCVCVCVLL